MTPLSGFSDNQFCDRKYVLLATQAPTGGGFAYFQTLPCAECAVCLLKTSETISMLILLYLINLRLVMAGLSMAYGEWTILRHTKPTVDKRTIIREVLQFSSASCCTASQLQKLTPIESCDIVNEQKTLLGNFGAFSIKDGAAIPFGRSLTYRSATAAFYSAFALA